MTSDPDCAATTGDRVCTAEDAARLASTFSALADPTRVRLYAFVASVPGGTVCACHLRENLGVSQPTLSHHLRRLVEAGLLVREQRGRWAHFTAVPGAADVAARYLATDVSV